MNLNTVSYEREGVMVQASISDELGTRVRMETLRDDMMRRTVYSFRAYMAQRQQWEKRDTIPMKLSWRQRIHALFGGEIPMELRVTVYRNCPHLPTEPQRNHLAFIAPDVVAYPRDGWP